MSESQKPQVAVVIPTRGKPELLELCLSGLLRSTTGIELEVVVVEQGGAVCKAMVEEKFPGVQVLAVDDSLSYSQMNNAGVASTTAPFLLLLNNDTTPRRKFLRYMLEAMEEYQDVGIVGAKILSPEGAIHHMGVALRHDGLPYHLGNARKNDGTFIPAQRDDYYDAVTFACALIRRQTWDAVGGLDEAYYFNFEDVDFCLRAAELGFKSLTAHRAIVIHEECSTKPDRSIYKISVARNFKILHEKWIASGRIDKIARVKLSKDAPTARVHLPNVAMVGGSKFAGVPWWRVEVPARKLIRKRLLNVITLYPDQNQDVAVESLLRAHVAVFQGFCSEWVKNIASAPERSFKLVYDYDDHPIHISPFSQGYRFFGCQEIKIKSDDGVELWLWRDGENGFDVQRNMDNRQRQLEIMSLANLLTTSTPPLHDYFKTLNKNVVMLPNQIDFDMYRHQTNLWQRKPGPVRIGWHGGDNHFHDISTIAKPLTDYVNSHDVQLVIFGVFYRGPFRGIDMSKVVEEPWVHVEAFPYKLATLGIDVAVIPLADPSLPFMKFNHYKSDIKFLEYSAMRIPSLVVAGRAAYACCTDGDNSLTFASDAEFTEKLDQLCSDAQVRSRLSARAYDWVREYRDLDKNIHRWAEAYEELADIQMPKDSDEGEVLMGIAKEA